MLRVRSISLPLQDPEGKKAPPVPKLPPAKKVSVRK